MATIECNTHSVTGGWGPATPGSLIGDRVMWQVGGPFQSESWVRAPWPTFEETLDCNDFPISVQYKKATHTELRFICLDLIHFSFIAVHLQLRYIYKYPKNSRTSFLS